MTIRRSQAIVSVALGLLLAAVPAGAAQWVLQRTLASPTPTSGGGFGSALTGIGPNLLVGSPGEHGGPIGNGAAYLIDPASGVPVRTFYSPSATACYFGSTVAPAAGAAWIGTFIGEVLGCRPEHFLVDPDSGAVLNTIRDPLQLSGDQTFGKSVAAVSGTRVLTGDQYDFVSGAGYLIDLGSPGGALLHVFTNPLGGYFFGDRVAADAGSLVIAARAGSVSRYDSTSLSTTWTHAAPNGVEVYGEGLAVDGAGVLVGSPGVGIGTGHAYLYALGGTLVRTFIDPTPLDASFFGAPVLLTPTQVIVADEDTTVSGVGLAGAVYVFDRASGAPVATLTAPKPGQSDFFGQAMATVGTLLVIAAPRRDAGATDGGAVYVYAPCGDGVLDPTEECDDGNLVPGDGCDPNCRVPGCGNGYVDVAAGEQCDDGNTVGGDGCRANCTLEVCGDGILDPQEQCDDGNVAPGDTCDPNCRIPGCGNGYVDAAAGEQCDDGNTIPGDCCSPTCQLDSAGSACFDLVVPGECNGAGTCVGIPTLSELGVLLGSLVMAAMVLWRQRGAARS